MSYHIRIGIIGDYNENKPYHIAINEAIRHCGERLSLKAEAVWLPTEGLEGDIGGLSEYDALWGAPGSPYKSFAGAINGIRFAREQGVPFLGTCGGCQHAVLEYAINVLGIRGAGHEELDPKAPEMVVTALVCSIKGKSGRVLLKEGSFVREAYGTEAIEEFFSCSYGLSPKFRDAFEKSGFTASGTDESGDVRALELKSNRFYVATLFQPQVISTPEDPHKLILRYLVEAKRFHNMKE